MKAILVLAAAAGALRAPRRRAPPPVVSIRGGAVSFAKIPYDGKALALARVAPSRTPRSRCLEAHGR